MAWVKPGDIERAELLAEYPLAIGYLEGLADNEYMLKEYTEEINLVRRTGSNQFAVLPSLSRKHARPFDMFYRVNSHDVYLLVPSITSLPEYNQLLDEGIDLEFIRGLEHCLGHVEDTPRHLAEVEGKWYTHAPPGSPNYNTLRLRRALLQGILRRSVQ